MADSALPTYGIDKEIKNKLASKLSNEQIADAKQWIETVLERELPALDQPVLKDGSVLVELLNKVTGSSVKVQRSELPFKQMENINAFLKGAEKIGCPTFDLFQTVDLFENKNFPQVIQCLFSFARHASKAGCSVPPLGPKIVDKNVRRNGTLHRIAASSLISPRSLRSNFSDEVLNAGKNIPSQQSSGFTGGASQSGYIFGLPRQIVDPRLGTSVSPGIPAALTGGLQQSSSPSGSPSKK